MQKHEVTRSSLIITHDEGMVEGHVAKQEQQKPFRHAEKHPQHFKHFSGQLLFWTALDFDFTSGNLIYMNEEAHIRQSGVALKFPAK